MEREGLNISQSTWDDHALLIKAYQNFNLEEMVTLNEGGNLTNEERTRLTSARIEGPKKSSGEKPQDAHMEIDPRDHEKRRSAKNFINY